MISEVVDGELIVPVCLIIGFIHRERLVVDALIVPLACFVEEVHLLCDAVCVDHVQIKNLILLCPEPP